MTPERGDVAAVWRYLKQHLPQNGQWGHVRLDALAARISLSVPEHSVRRTLPSLTILSELGLIGLQRDGTEAAICLIPNAAPNKLENSKLYQTLHI